MLAYKFSIMRKKYLFFMLLASIFFSSCKQGEDKKVTNSKLEQQIVFPEYLGYLSDYTNVLTHDQAKAIEEYITDFERQTSNEISIALFESVPIERDFKRYCIELGKKWALGKAGKDNGVIFIIDLQHKRGAIYTGDEISKVFTDEKCTNILTDIAFPYFKQDQYYEGIMNALIALVEIWKMEEYEHNL
ncbi:uncharacterized protein SAMN05421818_1407 [Myroides phaeus]|uniref:TPM domain-containing protein n=2 Tax=Myroides phaeus TaxID=702745 RepID=A0A1G8H3U7_9FLAO|nr:uncharacterized protein SAMN05421818_1407 [Myroides phaeus]